MSVIFGIKENNRIIIAEIIMRIAVEVLVPLRLFVYRFLSERRRSLLLALAVVAHLNLKFFKKIQIGGTHYGIQQSQRRKEMAALERSRGEAVTELGR